MGGFWCLFGRWNDGLTVGQVDVDGLLGLGWVGGSDDGLAGSRGWDGGLLALLLVCDGVSGRWAIDLCSVFEVVGGVLDCCAWRHGTCMVLIKSSFLV